MPALSPLQTIKRKREGDPIVFLIHFATERGTTAVGNPTRRSIEVGQDKEPNTSAAESEEYVTSLENDSFDPNGQRCPRFLRRCGLVHERNGSVETEHRQ